MSALTPGSSEGHYQPPMDFFGGKERQGLRPEQMREHFYLSEDVNDLGLSLASLERAQAAGFAVEDNTFDEVRRISAHFQDEQEQLRKLASEEQAEQITALAQKQQDLFGTAREKSESALTAGDAESHVRERARLGVDSTMIGNIARNITGNQTAEELGTEPANPQAIENMNLIVEEMHRRANQINSGFNGTQRERFFSLQEGYFIPQRGIDSEFSKLFEEATGIEYYQTMDDRLARRRGETDEEIAARKEQREAERVKKVTPEVQQWHERDCPNCGRHFTSRHPEGICYNCALEEITHGRAPEEPDFNSALIISGEITDEELDYLRKDLAAVEEGRSIRE